VFYQGRIVGYTKEYSDYLLIKLLEARRPAVWRSRHTGATPPDEGDAVLEIRWKEPESPRPQETPLRR